MLSKQKTVAVLEFTNSNGSKNYEYLNVSISEALITSIAKLKRFQVLESGALKAKLEQLKLDSTGLTQDATRKAAKLLRADIYISGSFLVVQNTVQINGRIFNASSGKVLGGAKITGEISSKLFDTLDRFSEKLVASLDKAVPQDRVVEKVVIQEKIVYRDGGFHLSNISFYAAPVFVSARGEMSSKLNATYGFEAGFGLRHLFLKNIYIGFATGFASFTSDKKNVNSLSLIPLNFMAGYTYVLPVYPKLSLLPYISGGLSLGSYSGKSGELSYSLGLAGAGLRIAHSLGESLSVYINNRVFMQFDTRVNLFYSGALGVLWRL